jgi:hypothetical protein
MSEVDCRICASSSASKCSLRLMENSQCTDPRECRKDGGHAEGVIGRLLENKKSNLHGEEHGLGRQVHAGPRGR